MTTVKLNRISKCYPNGFEAVKALELEVKSGEFIALVGPSGCGKSTTLRMIAGLEEISSGELWIDEILANSLQPKERGVAMVFQSYALYPHMTAYENIAFALTLQKMPLEQIERRVHSVANKLQIADLLPRKPKEMSGGQRQRVAMARAIAREPKIFLFDEPLSNLDAQLRSEMRIEIMRLQREMKTTSFYVTHDQVEAMTLADRVVLLKAGQVQQIGPPLELHDHPANRFVATFIGSPTMNILSVKLKDQSLCFLSAQVQLSPEWSERLQTQHIKEGEAIDLGIRPHQISLYELSKEPTRTAEQMIEIRVKIEAIEPLGSETICYCQPSDHSMEKPIVVKLTTDLLPQREQEYQLAFLLIDCHLFRADEQGERLL